MLGVWVEAGQPAATFWDQTPALFAAILDGCKRREQRSQERFVELAWRIENFSRSGKRFRDLDHYLRKLRPRRPQTAEEVIGIFETLAKRGLATIKVIEKDGGNGG